MGMGMGMGGIGTEDDEMEEHEKEGARFRVQAIAADSFRLLSLAELYPGPPLATRAAMSVSPISRQPQSQPPQQPRQRRRQGSNGVSFDDALVSHLT